MGNLKKIPGSVSRWGVLLVFVLTLAITIPVRVVQFLYFIDFNSGFYVSGDVTGPILIGLLWAGCLAIAFFLIFGRISYPQDFLGKNKPLGIIGFLSGLFILIEMAQRVIVAVPKLFWGVVEFSQWVQIATLLLASLALTSWGLRLFGGEIQKTAFGFFTIMPTFWAALALMTTFMEHTTIPNISENLLDVLALSALTIFLYSFSRVSIGSAGRFTETLLNITAAFSGIFGLLSAIPRFGIILFGDIATREYISVPDFAVFGVSLFATGYLVAELTKRSARYSKRAKAIVSPGPEKDLVE